MSSTKLYERERSMNNPNNSIRPPKRITLTSQKCFEATAVSHYFQGICLPILALPEWLCHVSQQQGATLIGAQEQFRLFLIASTTHLDHKATPGCLCLIIVTCTNYSNPFEFRCDKTLCRDQLTRVRVLCPLLLCLNTNNNTRVRSGALPSAAPNVRTLAALSLGT